VTYYTHIPNSEAPTAEIEASSTKHARTAYLDYLSRNHIITWQQRQQTRRLVKVNRMQPGEIQTQVKLEYGVKEVPVQEIEAPTDEPATEEEGRYEEYLTGAAEGLTTEERRRFATREGDFVPTPEQPTRPRLDPLADMPIAKLSKRSMGA